MDLSKNNCALTIDLVDVRVLLRPGAQMGGKKASAAKKTAAKKTVAAKKPAAKKTAVAKKPAASNKK